MIEIRDELAGGTATQIEAISRQLAKLRAAEASAAATLEQSRSWEAANQKCNEIYGGDHECQADLNRLA